MATKEVRPASRTRVRFPILPPEDLTGIPPGPRVPRHLLGASWLLREHRLLERCRRRYGNVFSLNVWPMGLVVVICDPAEIKRVFTGDSEQLEAGAGNAVLEPLGGPNSLFILDGEEHLHQRRLMLPPFHGKRIGVYGDLVTEITETEIDRMPLDKPFELHPHMLTITLAVILRAVFGIEDADRREELESIIPELLNSPVLVWPPLARDFGPYRPRKRFRELRKAVNAMLYDEIERKRVDPRLEERDDVLSMLILARDENGEGMTDVDLRDQLITLLLAGHESTATTLAWTFERLLRNPQVLDRLRSSLAEDDETYLDCTIKESLRSRPIVPYAVRRLSAPMEVGGYTVPTGAFVGISTIL